MEAVKTRPDTGAFSIKCIAFYLHQQQTLQRWPLTKGVPVNFGSSSWAANARRIGFASNGEKSAAPITPPTAEPSGQATYVERLIESLQGNACAGGVEVMPHKVTRHTCASRLFSARVGMATDSATQGPGLCRSVEAVRLRSSVEAGRWRHVSRHVHCGTCELPHAGVSETKHQP